MIGVMMQEQLTPVSLVKIGSDGGPYADVNTRLHARGDPLDPSKRWRHAHLKWAADVRIITEGGVGGVEPRGERGRGRTPTERRGELQGLL
jgi:hypothetical protein